MMMRGHVRFEAQRAVMERNFFEHTRIQERLHILVNRAQRNRRDPLPDLLVNQFRGRMFTRVDNGFVDDLALEGEGKTLIFTTPAEVLEGLRTQV